MSNRDLPNKTFKYLMSYYDCNFAKAYIGLSILIKTVSTQSLNTHAKSPWSYADTLLYGYFGFVTKDMALLAGSNNEDYDEF